MKIITVANQKGGCGKTITAVSLAGALSGLGRKILLIDLDPQAHATSALGVGVAEASQSSYAIFELFLNSEEINLHLLAKQKYRNLEVIASHISLSTMEQKLTGIKDAVMVLSNTLRKGGLTGFDYIIIDTPPSLGFLTLNALHAAHHIIVPLDISLFSLNGVAQIEEILGLSKSMGFERPQVNFLITALDRRSNFAKSFIQKAGERFENQLLQTMVRPNIRLREAVQAGKVIFEYDFSSNGAKDYLSLAKELAPECRGELFHMEYFASEESIRPQTFFKLYAPEAAAVRLAGSFNNWDINNATSLMKKLDNGTWIKVISLPGGTYHYKFVVDGQWIEDPANDLMETNGLGGKNSLISVKTHA